MTPLRAFRYVAFLEATSFLALLVATVLKYSDKGDTGVQILGPVHGALFLAYVALVLLLRAEQRWDVKVTLLLLLGAVIPFGGYVVDWWLVRRQPAAA
jgi:integral membrane protein